MSEISLISPTAPILLVNNADKQINVLLRDDNQMKKIEIRRIISDFKNNIPKGALYKIEINTDPLTVQHLLSSAGIIPESAIGKTLQIRFSSELKYADLYEYFESKLSPKRQELVTLVLQAIQNKDSLDLDDLSKKTGITKELIESLISQAIETDFLQNTRIENGIVFFE
jgi:repressor of nif and glnA expression